MSYSISNLLIRNLRDVFGENDPTRRRAAIDELWAEDGIFYESGGELTRGNDDRQEGIFSYISPEKRVPSDHPLRPIRRMGEILKEMSPEFSKLYSPVARPSMEMNEEAWNHAVFSSETTDGNDITYAELENWAQIAIS